jgi:hypothetical protein
LVPTTFGTYVPVQVDVSLEPPAAWRVHDPGAWKEPPASPVIVTLPVGTRLAPAPVSRTVTVHVTSLATLAAGQSIVVADARVVAIAFAGDELEALWSPLPP